MKENAYTIRRMRSEDLDEVMQIWLKSNQQAHSFIPAEYWEEKSGMVRELIKQAEVYTAFADGMLAGFIGLDDGYIAGIFVSAHFRQRGVGTALLVEAKQRFAELQLHVYVKNRPAVLFYEKEDFSVRTKTRDQETGEEEYLMIWERSAEKSK